MKDKAHALLISIGIASANVRADMMSSAIAQATIKSVIHLSRRVLHNNIMPRTIVDRLIVIPHNIAF